MVNAFRAIASAIWFLFLRAAPAPIISADFGAATTSGANSVVALRASTGEFVWGFQVVHHDLWDYDVASEPILFTWRDGTPAIAVTTKMGRVFVLNRLTGVPLLPVEERPVPKSDIPEEDASPTQPSSTISTVPEKLSPEDAWGTTPEEKQACAEKIKRPGRKEFLLLRASRAPSCSPGASAE